MKKNIIFGVLVILTILSLHVQLQASGYLKYIMFSGDDLANQTDELVLLGDTQVASDGIFLTNDVNQTSGLYVNDPIVLGDIDSEKGFSTFYDFSIYKNTDDFGEGIAFVFSNHPELGDGQTNLGVGGLVSSIAFDLDFFSQTNDFAAPHVGTEPIIDGFVTENAGGVGLNLSLINRYQNTLRGNKSFDIFVWIDYQASLREVKFYVSNTPNKPEAFQSHYISEDFTHFDTPFYAGVTSSSTSNVMDIKLNEMYVDDLYNASSLDVSYYDYETDNVSPTTPNIRSLRTSVGLNFVMSGSTDNISEIVTYEYSIDGLTWIDDASVAITEASILLMRSVDRAGNRSSIIRYDIIEVQLDRQDVGSVFTQLYYLGEDYIIPTGQRNDDYIVMSWTLESGMPIVNANELTESTTLYAQTQKHTYSITYEAGEGTQSGNPEVHSILDDDVLLLPAERSGYAFTGWFADGEKIEYLSSNILDNISLVAQYEPLILPLIIYGFNGDIQTLSLETEYRFGSFDAIEVPTGYEFVGFYTEPFGQGERITEGTQIMNAETFTVFPYIRKINTDTYTSTQLLMPTSHAHDSGKTIHVAWILLPLLLTSTYLTIKRRGYKK